jgi:3-phosphoglycerate kinase
MPIIEQRIILLEHIDLLAKQAAESKAKLECEAIGTTITSAAASARASQESCAEVTSTLPSPLATPTGAGRKATPQANAAALAAAEAERKAKEEAEAKAEAMRHQQLLLESLQSVDQNLALAQALRSTLDAITLDTFPRKDGQWEKTLQQASNELPSIALGLSLSNQLNQWQALLQNFNENPNQKLLVVVLGGKCLTASKLRLLDSLLEVADTIYFTGGLAVHVIQLLLSLRVKKNDTTNSNSSFTEEEEAIELLQRKAERKHVRLLLPFDWIVGDLSLDEVDTNEREAEEEDASKEQEEEEEEQEEEEEEEEEQEEEEEEEEEDQRERKKTISKKEKQKTKKLQVLVERTEYEEYSSIFLKPVPSYEGSKAHVLYKEEVAEILETTEDFNETPREKIPSEVNDNTWKCFNEVKENFLERFVVIQGKKNILREKEWVQRIFDIGSNSMEILKKDILTRQAQVFLNGSFGVMEFQDFHVATKKFVQFCLENSLDLFIAGEKTIQSLVRFFEPNQIHENDIKNAIILKHIASCQPHPMLSILAEKD